MKGGGGERREGEGREARERSRHGGSPKRTDISVTGSKFATPRHRRERLRLPRVVRRVSQARIGPVRCGYGSGVAVVAAFSQAGAPSRVAGGGGVEPTKMAPRCRGFGPAVVAVPPPSGSVIAGGPLPGGT